MADVDIKITNIREIKAAFKASPDLMIKNLDEAIAKSIYLVKGKSQMNTPVRTGRLRSSTYTRVGSLRGEVGTNTNYDRFVHDGTRYMKARPYLRSAVNSLHVEINSFFKEAVDKTLNTIGKMT